MGMLDDLPNMVRLGGDPKLRCAVAGCPRYCRRDVRESDKLPVPSEAGWYEVQLPNRQRTTVFACSQRHATYIATSWDMPGALKNMRAFSDRPVLPG